MGVAQLLFCCRLLWVQKGKQLLKVTELQGGLLQVCNLMQHFACVRPMLDAVPCKVSAAKPSLLQLTQLCLECLQALSQSLNGLNFYSQRPPDASIYNGVIPAAPVPHNALLEGLQPPDAGYMSQAMIPNVHAMHAAAAMQQAGRPLPCVCSHLHSSSTRAVGML